MLLENCWEAVVASWSAIARRIRVPLSFAFAVVYLWLAMPAWRSLVLGAALAIPGLIVRALASGYVEKNEQLATSGPYAYTRHPLYLGSLMLAAAFAVAARSWWIVLAMAVIVIAIYLPVIRAEEVYLAGRFPEYSEYAARVPRLLPRWSARTHPNGKFSSALYWKHREYNAVLGFLGLMAALVAKLMLSR